MEQVRDFAKLASDIKDALGEENIVNATHCATRLRLTLKQSPAKEVTDKISRMPSVIQVMEKGGQYQIVIGTHAKDVYEELSKIMAFSETSDEDAPKQGLAAKLFGIMSGCMAPCIYILAAAGLLQGILIIVGLFSDFNSTGAGQVLNFISWTPFTYLPVMIAVAGSRYFHCNTFVALWCALALVSGSWNDMASAIAGGDVITFFGIPMAETTYSSTVLPPLIMVGVLSMLEHAVEKRLPDAIAAIATPLICAAVMVPATILVIGPISELVATLIANGYTALYNAVPWLASAILGGIWQPLIIFGVHWGITPIIVADYNSFGWDTIQASCAIAVCAQMAGCFGVWFKAKNHRLKKLAFSSGIPTIFGISEAAIYGVTLPLKKPFVGVCIAGALGSLVGSLFQARYFTYAGLPSILTVVNAIDTVGAGYASSFMGALLGSVVAIVVAFLFVQFVGFDEEEEPAEEVAA